MREVADVQVGMHVATCMRCVRASTCVCENLCVRVVCENVCVCVYVCALAREHGACTKQSVNEPGSSRAGLIGLCKSQQELAHCPKSTIREGKQN